MSYIAFPRTGLNVSERRARCEVGKAPEPELPGEPTHDAAAHAGNPRSDDGVLIQRTLDGDRAAFDALMERYVPIVLGYICGRAGRGPETEDLLQETFLTAYTKLRRLQRPDRFGPWLIAIARNKLMDARRREATRRRIDSRPAESNVNYSLRTESRMAEGTPAVSASFAETQGLAMEAIGQLNDSYRTVLFLRLIEELSPQEIAGRLGLRKGTVRVRLLRGLKKLRKLLAEKGISSPEK
ncbi:MAG: RNA polymerase sigma factor [Proteobacteria bacterium]|nr:RNA polymerase sigma factor [Pseudomonadota bacterium]